MAWGYERSFTIEHDNTLKRRIDCKDCIYYDSDDKSCMKRPLYLPVDGYNSWRNCKHFELDHSVSHYDEKSLQYVHELARRKRQQEQHAVFTMICFLCVFIGTSIILITNLYCR